MPPPSRATRAASWCGALAACIGAVVVAAWHLGLASVIRFGAETVEMRYVTALMLVCCGTALWGAAREHRRWPVGLAVLATIAGAVTLAEYLFGVDLGIDHLGPEQRGFSTWPHPGRMAPYTTLAILLTGCAVLIMCLRSGSRTGRAAVAVAGCVVVALAAANLVGYAFGISVGSAGGVFLPMAIQAASGLLLLGAGLVAWAAALADPDTRGPSPWLAIGIVIGGMGFTWMLWIALTQKEDRAVSARLDADASLVRAEAAECVAGRLAEFSHVVEEWAATPEITQEGWEARARRYARGFGGTHALAWIVPELGRTWIVSAEARPSVRILDVVQADLHSIVPDPLGGGADLRLVGSVPGPGATQGSLVALVSIGDLLDKQLTDHGLGGLVVRLFERDREVHRFGKAGATGLPEWSRTVSIDVPRISLSARVFLTESRVEALRSAVPLLVLCAGIAMFALLGLAVHLADRARIRERQAEGRAHALAREVERHAGTSESLRRSSTLFEGLFDAAPDAVVVVDPAGRIVRANERAVALFGWSREELLTMRVEALVPPRHRADHPAHRRELLRAPDHRAIGARRDLSAVRRDGTEFPIDLNLARLAPGENSLVIAVVHDVTERRRGVEALLESTNTLEQRRAELAAQGEMLRASEARFRRVVENISDGIVVDDLEGRVLFANSRFLEILGIPPGALPGLRLEDYVAPSARAELRARHDRRVRGGDEPSQYEFEGLHRDGTSRWIEVLAVVLRDEDGKIVGTQSALRDVTERRNAAVALRDREEQLRQAQKMEAVGLLAGGVAHDFNNLLCVILGYGRMVADALGAGSPHAPYVEQIVRAGQAAEALTRQLLTFSRKQVLQPRVLDLNTVVRGVEKMLRRVIGEDIALVTELAPEPAVALVDAGQMEQVLMNLVVNARDAMPAGGRLTIRTASERGGVRWGGPAGEIPIGPWVILAVTDTGVGMDPATQARVFEPFFTTKPPGSGTGLGLATVHGIVHQSGGEVRFASAVGAGTEFRVYLPRLALEAEREGHAPVDVHGYDGRETVLVAEDQAPVREIVRIWLERRGYRVLEAADGRAGMEVAAAHDGHVDLLVTDVVMPRANGRELADVLRARERNLPVLYISGYTNDMIDQRGGLEPGVRLLDKPLSEASFLRAVRESLDAASPKSGHAGESR